MGRIVTCKDKSEALRMLDAGLLMLRIHAGRFYPASEFDLRRKWVVENYGMAFGWPPNDFGYLVDDEDG